jgi:G3E family GTPase
VPFDAVVIETTGLADPSPVAQTFFMDDTLQQHYALDAIVTVVDAKHCLQHLQDNAQCKQQVAFADVILLNKVDLVSEDELAKVQTTLQRLNPLAQLHTTTQANLGLHHVLNLNAFDLNDTLIAHPHFLEAERPYEWAGLFTLEAGNYSLGFASAPDPSFTLACLPATTLAQAENQAEQRFNTVTLSKQAGDTLEMAPVAYTVRLDPLAKTVQSVTLQVETAGSYALFTQHTPAEFGLQLNKADDPAFPLLYPTATHDYHAAHSHDDHITSVGLTYTGWINPNRFNLWMGYLLQEQGENLYRAKGVLAVEGEAERYLFQSVHMLFNVELGSPWQPNEAPENRLVFIGKNLNRYDLAYGFEQCLVASPSLAV